MRESWTTRIVLGGVVLVGACTPYGGTPESDETALPGDVPQTVVEPEIPAPSVVGLSGASKRRCEGIAGMDAVPLEDAAGFDRGTMRSREGDELLELPLRETTFESLVVGTVVETAVTQVFVNPFETPIEAVYAFPLPQDGAVDDYWLRVGERSIHGVMKRREEAKADYERARREGRSAGLLEQERPNIFTQSVANIAPGETIEVQMHVVAPLEQDAGRYRMVLPTVVGPRFVPGTSVGHKGGGFADDTDQVPDGSRITPSVLPARAHACAPLKVTVDIDTGFGLEALKSKYHAVTMHEADGLATVELRDGEAIANRDFDLSWEVAGDEPRASLMVQPGDDGGGYFTLTVQPPDRLDPGRAVPRDLIFVVDNSGSMYGTPMDTAKAAVMQAVHNMNPDDAFQILRFSESASGLADRPLSNTPANRKRGIRYIDAMEGMGGTHMLAGIEAALGQPRAAGRMPIVLFLTDGYIGNEAAVFGAIDADLDGARLFSLGVGSSVNRYLLDGMAKMGRGAVTYVGPGEKPGAVVDRFYERIAYPVLTDIEIDWGELEVREVTPAAIPDLFVGQPLTVFGRFEGQPHGTAIVRGRLGDRDVEIPVTVDLAGGGGRGQGLGSIWARQRVDDLIRSAEFFGARDEAKKQRQEAATELALRHRVMTEFTAFVAVDEQRIVNPDGTLKTVQVPVEMPQGVSHERIFGEQGMARIGTGPGGGGTGEGNIGLGGIGLVGKGGGGGSGSGYGRGNGAGFGGRGARVPQVRQAKVVVRGTMSRQIIRRIVRAHITEVRGCYNHGLTTHPDLKGRVVIQFVIDGDGTVVKAVVKGSDLGDEGTPVGACIAQAVKEWKFPAPEDRRTAIVNYPFVLAPG